MMVLMRQVLNTLLENMVAPAVAASGDVDEVVKTLKKAVVVYIDQRYSLPKDLLARHFGKSDRWVYRYLEELSRQKRKGQPAAEEAPQEDSLQKRILYLVVERYPEALTARQIQQLLDAKSFQIEHKELESMLRLYADAGLLKAEAIGADGTTMGYASPVRTMTMETREMAKKMNLIGTRSRAIFPIAMSFAKGDDEARFSYTHVRVRRKLLAAAVNDTRAFMMKRFNQAVEESLLEDPEERDDTDVVDYTLLFLGGLCRVDQDK